MANFNPYQFTNSHYPPDYSQYGDGLFSPFSSQMFSQDSQPSTSQLSLNKLNRDWRNVAKKTSTSLMSTKLIVFGAIFSCEILRVDSPVSNIIYVPHVRPPRLPWRKYRDIFVGQHMTRHKKKGHSATPALGGKYVANAHKGTLHDSALVQQLHVYLRLHQ